MHYFFALLWIQHCGTRKNEIFVFSAGCLARNAYAALREAAAAILIQKYVRRWLLMGSYLKLHSSTVLVQSCIRGFLTRQRFLHGKEHRAATLIQVNLIWCPDVSCGVISNICS